MPLEPSSGDVQAPRQALAPLGAPRRASSAASVHAVAIPPDVSPENRAQLERLADALQRGDLPQREYDELVPFLLRRDQRVPPDGLPPGRGSSLGQGASPYALLEASAAAGLSLRCPACGSANDTARGLRCTVCGEAVVPSTGGSQAQQPPVVQAQAGVPPPPQRDSRHREVFYTLTEEQGAFRLDEDGSGRVVAHDGYFFCDMHGTQAMAGAGGRFDVFVLLCQWEPRRRPEDEALGSARAEAATWFVSQRFSNFEALDHKLRARFGRKKARHGRRSSEASLAPLEDMPAFPPKYHWSDQLGKRRAALAAYMVQLVRFCAVELPRIGAKAPELDQFLTVSRQVEQFRRRSLPPTVAAAFWHGGAPPSVANQPPQPRMRLPQQPPTPLDAHELVQAEQAVQLLLANVEIGGDLRRNTEVQQQLATCLELLPALKASADVESPFADIELLPRALQCVEDLERAVATYNDALLASLSMVGVESEANANTQTGNESWSVRGVAQAAR